MKLQRITDGIYERYFAHVHIRVEVGIDIETTTLLANGHHISTFPTHEIVESDLTFDEFIEDILINANVGR